MDNLQVNRFVLRQILCHLGLPGWPGKRDYMENFQPGCHVIAKLIFVAFNRRAEISENQASSANWASPARVIGPLLATDTEVNSCFSTYYSTKIIRKLNKTYLEVEV